MCGIAGKLLFSPPADDGDLTALLQRMAGRMCHRGPDAQGVFVDHAKGIALSHRRLAIVDLDPRAEQPMATEGTDRRAWITFNGEIYNFLDLRDRLERSGRCQFRTTSDTEVLLNLYREFGPERAGAFLDELRGMYAFGLWDEASETLLLARDPLGKKPLYYAETASGLVFASEVSALFQDPEVPRRIDFAAVQLYLALGYIPAPLTGFVGVYKLPAAHYMLASRCGVQAPVRYWHPQFEPKRRLPEPELERLLLDGLSQATRRRMVSDVPLGAFLSGGLDSSAVVAMMAQASEQPVRTFSVGFADRGLDESDYARLVATHFGCQHTELQVEAQPDILPTLIKHFGEPFADPAAIPSYYMAEAARCHVTVVLTGDGGDEDFAGYDLKHVSFLWAERLPLGAPARHVLGVLANLLPDSAGDSSLTRRIEKSLLLLSSTGWERHVTLLEPFTRRERAARLVVQGPLTAAHNTTRAQRLMADIHALAKQHRGLDRELFYSFVMHLPDQLLTKVDRATMAHSIEVRSPLLDRDLVDLCASIPPDLKLHGTSGKYIFKRALRGLLPEVILRRRKHGFHAPIARWMRGPWVGLLRDALLCGDSFAGAFLNPYYVRRLVDEHVSGQHDHNRQLYTLLVLELWHRSFIQTREYAAT